MRDKRRLFYLIWIFLAVIIFILSAQPRQVSYQLSSSVVNSFNQQVNQYIEWDAWTELRKFIFVHSRKFAHALLYCLLTIFGVLSVYRTKLRKTFSIVASVNLLYAISDEIHQSFVPGRGASTQDVFIDFVGIVAGILICYLVYFNACRVSGTRNWE